MTDFELLGSFYLGRELSPETGEPTDDLLLYDSKDLVTHAVCVGMTGSGKTGLCLSLLEEAAIDGIPAIIIDPKGDLANLLLTFPDLAPRDFEPWVNADDGARQGLSVAQLAEKEAKKWRDGLAAWGQSGERIKRLRESADFAVYTPGSNAGIPVSVLRSFDAPPPAILNDAELLRERVGTTTTSLLGLLGVNADPIRSREHILLSNILAAAWSEGGGRSLDLGGLIQQIQSPPMSRIGVMELEAFYPAPERFTLAMQLNGLLASPGFSAWMEGEPLDVGAFLRSPSGKPRLAIFSIAHLPDAERMFFVSMLLEASLAWARSQTGTTSLRALIYMDEIAGYVPPVANPPSKQPMLTLMKQARAFGVGVVLATQNPVDLDYKGLSNAGTWFIGRLQTDRDKQRLLDGLEGASAQAGRGFDRAAMDTMISGLRARAFLMNNVHDSRPVLFETRWAMSYLRGPMTREELKRLKQTPAGPVGAPTSSASTASQPSPRAVAPVPIATSGSTPQPAAPSGAGRPILPPDIRQCFIPARGTRPANGSLLYKPMLLGVAKVSFSDAKAGVDITENSALLAPPSAALGTVDWDGAEALDLAPEELSSEPLAGASFAPPSGEASKPRSYDGWKKDLADSLYRTRKLDLFRSAALKQASKPGESERDFRARLAQKAREERDAFAEKLREKYAPKFATLQDRIRRAEQQVEVQQEQAKQAKFGTAISFGAAVLGAFLGKKAVSTGNVGRASTAARGVSRSMKESSDVGRAEENVEAIKQQLAALQAQCQSEIDERAAGVDPMTEPLETITIRAKKTGITSAAVVLAWTPFWRDASGQESRAM